MTDEQIIIAVAKLDGWEQGEMNTHWFSKLNVESGNYSRETGDSLPPYLNSRDAIIPVIKKQSEQILGTLVWELWKDLGLISASSCTPAEIRNKRYTFLLLAAPRQLCVALLKATNNWKE